MNRSEPFGGALWLRPGHPRPHNLRSTRPDWVGRLTRGLPASRLPVTLASLFSLCGHAHSICAELAVNAALGRDAPVPAAVHTRLAQETLREHLRRLWLDWPRRLAVAPASDASVDASVGAGARTLAQSPVFAAVPVGAAAWLATQALGMPPAEWLSAWVSDPAAWLRDWCAHTDTLPARLLRECRAVASDPLPEVPPLKVHAEADALRAWAPGLRDAAFARQPRWQGGCAETGVWTRLNDTAMPLLSTTWLRLGARLAESARLALPEASNELPPAAAWLAVGALPLARGEAVAWVEMARGLLLHHVQLEGEGDAARVDVCHVVAPTEWNCHPHGAVAQALERLPRERTPVGRRRLDALMAAYDPCVPFKQDQPMPVEVAHA